MERELLLLSRRFCHATHLPQGLFGAAIGVLDNKVFLNTHPGNRGLIMVAQIFPQALRIQHIALVYCLQPATDKSGIGSPARIYLLIQVF